MQFLKQISVLGLVKNIKDIEFSIIGNFSKGIRSNIEYTDIYGDSYDMSKNSRLNAKGVNAYLKYKNLSLSYLSDHLYMQQRDHYDAILSKAYSQDFKTNCFRRIEI